MARRALVSRYEVPLERPRAIRQVAELVYGTPIDYVRLANDARLTERFVRELIEVHTGRNRPREQVDSLNRADETSAVFQF